MKQKIGILTFHRALNYGAVLQAYSLSRTLEAMGMEVEIIDYYCKAIDDVYRPFYAGECRTVSLKVKKLLKSFQFLRKRKSFDSFLLQDLKLGRKCKTREELLKEVLKYDMVITGSDQVFNLDLTGGEWTYYLDFLPQPIRRISYGGSFGKYNFTKEQERKIVEELKKFDRLSFREPQAVSYVKSLCGLDVPAVLDPVFLMSKDQWESMAEKPKGISEKYVLVHLLGDSVHGIRKARELSKAIDGEVVIVNPTLKQIATCHDCRKYTAITPREYLWLMSHAEHVVTTSFHGLAFSIILNKDCYVEIFTKNVSSRITNLIDLFNLSDRLLPDAKAGTIHCERINEILNVKKKESLNFLKSCFENVETNCR